MNIHWRLHIYIYIQVCSILGHCCDYTATVHLARHLPSKTLDAVKKLSINMAGCSNTLLWKILCFVFNDSSKFQPFHMWLLTVNAPRRIFLMTVTYWLKLWWTQFWSSWFRILQELASYYVHSLRNISLHKIIILFEEWLDGLNIL